MTAPDDAAEIPDDPEVPGLAAERTDLAWSRTSLAATAAAAAMVKRLWEEFGTTTARVVVYSMLAVGGLAWWGALWWAHVTARASLAGRQTRHPEGLRRMTIGTLIFCAAALILAAAPHSK